MSRSSFKIFSAICIGILIAELIGLRRRLKLLEQQKKGTSPEFKKEAKKPSQATMKSTVDSDSASTGVLKDISAPTAKSVLKDTVKPVPKDIFNSTSESASVTFFNSASGAAPSPKEPKSPTTVKNSTHDIKKDMLEDSTPLNRIVGYLKHFFTTGNVVLKLGIIIIFFGVSFLLKYAAQRNMVPIEFRLMGVFAAGVLVLLIGWHLRNRPDPRYGLALQGGGLGILYLTVFAAARLYTMLPAPFSMAMMLLLMVFSALLALMQDAKSLAIFAIAGGFISPVLLSTGSGGHVMLFSYYAILNSGILAIAWFKAWRELNLIGFAFTFIISAMWGSRYYRPVHFSTTEPFLILFFLFYVMISILFAHRQPLKLKGFIDGPLVFGVPLIFFTLQGALVKNMEFGLALTAVAMGLFYISLATLLWRRLVEGMRMLTEAFLSMGVVFGSIAIPMALDAQWTSTAWALEGGAMVWVGIRQKRLPARLFGLLLQLGSGVVFFLTPLGSFIFSHHLPVNMLITHGMNGTLALQGLRDSQGHLIFLNHIYLGAFFISIAGLFSSFYLSRNPDNLNLKIRENRFHLLLLVWGILWWFDSGLHETGKFFTDQSRYHAFLLYCTFSLFIMSMVAIRLKWQELKQVQAGFLPIMLILVPLSLFHLFGYSHLFEGMGMLIWTTAFIVQYRLLCPMKLYGLWGGCFPMLNTPVCGQIFFGAFYLLCGYCF